MTFREFYFGGVEGDGTIVVDVSAFDDVEDLMNEVARGLGVARAESVTLHTTSGSLIETLHDAETYKKKITVKVDSKLVRRPEGPRQLPIVGNFLEIYPDHMGNHDRLFRRYGNVVKTVNMGTTTYLTNDPRVSQVVLSESEFFTKTTSDPNHPLFHMKDDNALFMCDTASPAFKNSHKFIPPSMSPKAVRRYTPIVQKAVEQSFRVFDELDEQGRAFHTYQYMFKMAGQVIYQVVLGLDVGHFKTIDTPPHEIIHLLGEYMILMKQTSLSPQWYKYLPFGPVRRLDHVRTRAWRLVDEAIRDCEPGGDGQDAPIQQAALDSTCIADYLKRATDEAGNKLRHEYLLTNVVVLIGAGFVTSASLLSWLLYSLTQYPGAQERLLQELVDSGATPTQAVWTYDEITELPYLDRFVKETHRMHNPSFQTARNAKRDVVVPGGWRIPAKSVVIPTFPSIHKNKDHWDNPEVFDPDRWADNAANKSRHRMAYTPFAAGPRGCVGYNVAQLEAKLVLANLVYRYQFSDASQEPMLYDPEFLVIRPLNTYVRAVKRTTWPAKRGI